MTRVVLLLLAALGTLAETPPLPPASGELPDLVIHETLPPEFPLPPTTSETNAVVYALARSRDPAQRCAGIGAIDGEYDAYGVYLGLTALTDPAPEVRETALAMLENANGALLTNQMLGIWLRQEKEGPAVLERMPALRHKVEKPFIALLDQSDAPVLHRVWAAHALGRMNSVDSIDSLLQAAWVNDQALAWYALWALAELPGEAALQALLDLCRHPDESFRWTALEAARSVPGRLATAGLGKLLTQLPPNAADMAAHLVLELVMRNDPAAVPYLIAALELYPAMVRQTGDALRALTGAELPNTAQAWRDWQSAVRGPTAPIPRGRGIQLHELLDIDEQTLLRLEQSSP